MTSDDTGEFEDMRARRAALRSQKPNVLKRYLAVMGVLALGLAGLGVWLKPSPETMRETVEQGLAEYARVKTEAGETLPAVTHQESRDWLLAVSHVATVGDETFFCVGGFKVTYCDIP